MKNLKFKLRKKDSTLSAMKRMIWSVIRLITVRILAPVNNRRGRRSVGRREGGQYTVAGVASNGRETYDGVKERVGKASVVRVSSDRRERRAAQRKRERAIHSGQCS